MTPKSDKIKTVDAGKAELQGRLVKAQHNSSNLPMTCAASMRMTRSWPTPQ
jgi:hypothetical protein